MAVQPSTVAKIAEKVRDLYNQLEDLRGQKQETIDNEESKDTPNDERMSKYESQLDALDDALRGLEEAVDALEVYE
jgi:uncharacterized coiled-coil protein SlyX